MDIINKRDANIFLAVILVACLIPLYMLFGRDSEPNKQQAIRQPDGISAFVMSQKFVKQKLTSPGSAKFPLSQEAKIKNLDANTWLVTAHVDSQNGFGAMIRTRYQAKLKYLGAEKWQLLDIILYQ